MERPSPTLLPIAPPGTLPASLRHRPAVELDLLDVEPMDQVIPLVQAALTLEPDQILRVRIRALNWAAAAALQARDFHYQVLPAERPGERVLVVWHRYLPGTRREIHEHLPPLRVYRARLRPPERKAVAAATSGEGES